MDRSSWVCHHFSEADISTQTDIAGRPRRLWVCVWKWVGGCGFTAFKVRSEEEKWCLTLQQFRKFGRENSRRLHSLAFHHVTTRMMDKQPAHHRRTTASCLWSGSRLRAGGQRSAGYDTDRVRSTDWPAIGLWHDDPPTHWHHGCYSRWAYRQTWCQDEGRRGAGERSDNNSSKIHLKARSLFSVQITVLWKSFSFPRSRLLICRTNVSKVQITWKSRGLYYQSLCFWL